MGRSKILDKEGGDRNMKRIMYALPLFAASAVGAFAQDPDVVETVATTMSTAITGHIGKVAPLALGVMVVLLGIGIGVRWFKKAVKSS